MTDHIPALLERLDAEEMRRDLFHIAKDPLPCRSMVHTRPGASKPTLYEADDFIAEKLVGWGYDVEREACQVQAYRRDENKPIHHQYSAPHDDDPWYDAFNLYAMTPGSELPDELVLTISHKDSQSWLGCCAGAFDNAVGTVANLDIARVLREEPSRRTRWHVWCNEEHTPWTSAVTAERVKASGMKLVAALNIDSLGGCERADGDPPANVTAYATPEGERIADLQAELNERYGLGLDQSKYARPFPNDDDGSFVKAGMPAAAIMVGSFPYDEPNYHLYSDVPENVDFDTQLRATQLALATILELDRNGLPA